MTAEITEAVRAQRAALVGVVLFRWAAYAWMLALAVTAPGGFVRPWIAWGALAVAGAWTARASVPRARATWSSPAIELALALTLVVLSGSVVPRGTIVTRPFFATAWPLAGVIAWAVARGPIAGLGAGLAMSGALVASRAVNGIAPGALTAEQMVVVANGSITYVLAGVTVGIVARALERSAGEAERLREESIRARERAARLAERESLARQIHDSVLQALAMVHKRGREMAARETVSRAEVTLLADNAARQEEALRALIMREPEEPPTGRASLRDALERAARAIEAVDVSVSAVGPIWIPAHDAAELAAAATQALQNVSRHAGASHASVFADTDDGWVTVTVRDGGRGFDYDEDALRAAGKAGMLKSMKGRVEALGGAMRVETAPGKGTEVELRAPKR